MWRGIGNEFGRDRGGGMVREWGGIWEVSVKDLGGVG